MEKMSHLQPMNFGALGSAFQSTLPDLIWNPRHLFDSGLNSPTQEYIVFLLFSLLYTDKIKNWKPWRILASWESPARTRAIISTRNAALTVRYGLGGEHRPDSEEYRAAYFKPFGSGSQRSAPPGDPATSCPISRGSGSDGSPRLFGPIPRYGGRKQFLA